MLNQKKDTPETDALMELLEKIIDVRYQMLREREYSNYHEFHKLEERDYIPLVNEFRLYLDHIKK